MLDLQDYSKINTFKDLIHNFIFSDPKYKAFRKRVSVALEEIFDYKSVIFGYINNKKIMEINFNVTIHNINQNFVQSFLKSNYFYNEDSLLNSDVIVFSQIHDYKKTILYNELLTTQKYSDFLLFFLKVNDIYVGYIFLFYSGKKNFSEKDIEIINNIKDYLSVEYYNFSYSLQIEQHNHQLINQTNYYPIGIIIAKDIMQFYYANEVAKKYIGELEINSVEAFGFFFNNYLLPNIKNDMRSFGKSNIIRYKNFIFSIVSVDQFSDKNFQYVENSPHKSAPSINQFLKVITYIYIIKDELSSFSKEKEFFTTYTLSKRETMIVDLILLGKTNTEVSEELGISINTVRVHIRNIYKKTNTSNRAELIFKINSILDIEKLTE